MRLTWHPGDDIVRGFTPDGKVLFTSQRAVFSRRHSQFFTIGIDGGAAKALAGPDWRQGGHLARWEIPGLYAAGERPSPVEELSGRHGLADLGPQARRPVARGDPQAGRAAATTPSRCGSARPSTSSPIATANSISTRTIGTQERWLGAPTTTRFPVASASAGAGKVIYEQAGWIHLFDPALEQVDPAQDRRGGRPGRDAAPLCKRAPSTSAICRHLAHRQASRAGVPRRDRHRAGQEGRPAQPDRDARRARALARLVAGRQVDRLLLRRLGRICPGRPAAGRQGRRPDPTPSRERASTNGRSGRRTARRSPSSTTPGPSTGSTSRPEPSSGSPRADLQPDQDHELFAGLQTRDGSPTR